MRINAETVTPGWCIALGGTTALDTLGSQAFTGGDRLSVSIHLQRCILLLWLLFIPIAVLWAYIEPVLLLLGQEARLSHDVQAFLRVMIVGAPGYIGFESLKKYLQCQGACIRHNQLWHERIGSRIQCPSRH